MIHMGTICRHAKLNQWFYRLTTGSFIVWVWCSVLWVTKLRSILLKITPVTVKERGDIEMKDYVVLQKPQGQDNRLSPPRTLIMDFTMTNVRFWCSHLHPIRQITHTRCSDCAPDPGGVLKEEVRIKKRHYRNIYLNRLEPIVFLAFCFG